MLYLNVQFCMSWIFLSLATASVKSFLLEVNEGGNARHQTEAAVISSQML